jgi:hypothetical protein
MTPYPVCVSIALKTTERDIFFPEMLTFWAIPEALTCNAPMNKMAVVSLTILFMN